MNENRSMPSATVIPVLAYADVLAASEWLCGAFGFKEILRIGTHRVQLVFGDGAVILSQGQGAGSGHSIMVRVEDADGHYERAKDYGAKILQKPTDFPYGERQYNVEDLGGRQWTFSQTIADIDPASWGGTRPG